ncbi:ABC transporter ATP-binding protein [Actinokineospora sp. UTMC 2448]|uniref:ABC transporter ATP-binding protein n=1 Tax=Actinokineospora sp. UTMC 2448 TaxID=2268449 RepID=UPI0021645EFA|nr:ABC transporter ATP-binding protein [Actinokineospora sp. UTMC 2448]UVS78165.1 putative multidrug resistance ABC transporter ATP-binding/permease protein YheI [Actinokineospora sp. UTMC 2448]
MGLLRRTVARNGGRLWPGTLLICLFQACEAFAPVLIGYIIDQVIAGGDGLGLALWIGGLAGLILVQTSMYRLGARLLMLAIAHESHRLRAEVTERVLDPRGIRTDMRAGELLTVSSTDTDNTSYLLDYIPRVAGAVTATAVAAVTLLSIDVVLGLAVLVGTPVVLLVLQVGSPAITRRVAAQQEVAGEAAALATDLVSGLRPLRGIRAEDAALRRYREVSGRSLRAAVRAAGTQGGYLAASNALSALLACGIALLAGWFAVRGEITVGECIVVIGLAQVLIEPFGVLAIVPGWVAEARASADRVSAVLTAPTLVKPGPVDRVENVELTLSGVSYRSLDGLDLTVRPGEFVGVVVRGPEDGEALTALLAGRAAPDTGEVRLGGVRVDTLDLDLARATVLAEPHHTDLFTGTLADNLGPAADADLSRALAASAADQVVADHPDGLDQLVAERGTTLSGGQRQRIALARALLANPPVLVLHDPTTAVDAVTEHAIAHGVRDLRAGLSTVVVTSSPALLSVTDRVVMIDGGRVVAEGVHQELGASHESYRAAVLR